MDKNVCYAYKEDGKWILIFSPKAPIANELPKKTFRFINAEFLDIAPVMYKRNTMFKPSNLKIPKDLQTLLLLNGFTMSKRRPT